MIKYQVARNLRTGSYNAFRSLPAHLLSKNLQSFLPDSTFPPCLVSGGPETGYVVDVFCPGIRARLPGDVVFAFFFLKEWSASAPLTKATDSISRFY
jgi:hypothetical protein